MRKLLPVAIALTFALAACQSGPPPRPLPPEPQPIPAPPPREEPGTAQPPPSAPTPTPAKPKPRVTRANVLSPATRALVAQAQGQTAKGNYPVAAASIERALRIEPANPLLWIELGKVRAAEGNAAQAESMARKAISLAADDPAAQSAAWKLIAESLKARGRNPEAREAELRAARPIPQGTP